MSINPNDVGSVKETGSLDTEVKGSVKETGSPKISQEQIDNLEKLVGKQGQELGEYRKFFEDVGPLLEKLDKSPELVQAIIDGKVDSSLAKAAMEGKITVGDAQVVSKAAADVKKELGEKAYKASSSEEISRLVEEKVAEAREEFKGNLKEIEEMRAFESKVNDFISRTPDFATLAPEINKWLDVHDDITDIEVAYYAVKGQMSLKDAKKAAEEAEAEYAKDVALNAGGGSSRVTYSGDGATEVVDRLIAGKSNPNVF